MESKATLVYKRGIKWILGSAIVALSVAGGWFVYGRNINAEAAAIAVRLAEAERDTVERTVSESGMVKLGGEQTLKAPMEGTIAEVRVKPGDRVSPGEELVVLRDPEGLNKLENHLIDIRQKELELEGKVQALAAAERELAAARSNLDRVLSRNRGGDRTPFVEQQISIERAELDLQDLYRKAEDARLKLDTEREKLAADRELYDRGFIALNELRRQEEAVRQAETGIQNAELNIENKRLDIERLRAGIGRLEYDLDNAIETQENTIQQAREKVITVQSQVDTAESNLRLARLAVDELRLKTQEIEQQLQKNIISSPISGIVLDVKVRPGDVVELGDEALTVGDPNREVVELQLSTLNAREVEVYQTARVNLIGPDADTYEARVDSVSLKAGTEDSNSSSFSRNESGPGVAAILRLNEPSDTLISGSQVEVEIVVEQRQNVVVLEIEAIQEPEADPFVWRILDSNTVEKQPVTLGLEGLTTVEIESGLQAGDRIAIPPIDATLEPGMEVTIEEVPSMNNEQ